MVWDNAGLVKRWEWGQMDPVTLGAVLLAVVTGASEALGGHLWTGVVSLVRRPLRHRPAGDSEVAASGEAELAAFQQAPGDQQKAVVLAERLLARAADDAVFGQALQEWWRLAEPICAQLGVRVTNTINGGIQIGPVLQGQDFTSITFGAPTAPPTVSQPYSPGPPNDQ